ncbi:MAG: CoA-transferase [Thermodesulfobacteriota bacterium]|nr:CoA-transferase [Thermodesulfobacteriota bacterium]
MDKEKYTPAELMVAAASREISDGEVVFVGMRLPLLGFLLAKKLYAPNATGLYELGIVRDDAAPEPILTMGDLPNLSNATWLSSTWDMMGLLQQGCVDVSFIGGAQVDRFGNLNTSYVGDFKEPSTRLPGSGGACDLACLARRHIIIMAHRKHRFVEKVDFITSPGFGTGGRWRENQGLPWGGPSTVITDKGVLKFDEKTKEMTLVSLHPGVTLKEIYDSTGWKLKLAPSLGETKIPSKDELLALRIFDPHRFWTA